MKSLYYFLSIYLLPFIVGCKQKPLLEIHDLKFVNIDKNAIVLNQVDTTYLISDFKLYGYGRTDTFGYNVYDLRGNLIVEWRNNGGWGYNIDFSYDSNDLVIYKAYDTDFLRRFNITYKYIPDSLLLYQYWSDGDPYCLFYFNEKGILVNSLQFTYDDGNGSETRSVYNYDNSGKLIEKIDSGYDYRIYEMKFRRKFHGNEISSFNITKYFYTGQKLDSLITTYYIQDNPKNNHTSKTYFNESGLRYKTILMDTIITTYLHKSRSF